MENVGIFYHTVIWYILRRFGISYVYVHLVYFPPVLVSCAKKNLATLFSWRRKTTKKAANAFNFFFRFGFVKEKNFHDIRLDCMKGQRLLGSSTNEPLCNPPPKKKCPEKYTENTCRLLKTSLNSHLSACSCLNYHPIPGPDSISRPLCFQV
jgi:hypothetical protein